MRKKDKKQLLDLIKTMEAANQMLVPMLEKGQLSEMEAILANEQEAAQSIGNRIEQLEGNGTRAVALLEAYCEALWEITQTGSLEEKKTGIARLSVMLKEEEAALDEIRGMLEVVFLPYKASMWDCMETVWKAAQDDPDCNAFVIPIPYFDLKPDGTAGEMHYEANLLPDYVPIVSYRDYDLKKKHPDIIYIHNPYDNYNRVTSIHPDFYCSVIKNYTDQLVYISYFIMGSGSFPETHLNIPSYQIMDKIVVQDDQKMEELAKYVPKEKIVVLGTPKADHILEMGRRKEEIIRREISKEWRKKIKGKKVILFNISVSGILQHSGYAMDKIRYVLSRFDRREDMVLLWRPHPLIEATLKSMRPEMYNEYMAIKHSFLKKGKGILDENGDAGVAAAIADAYVGENTSSLIHYFGILGKPVFFISWDIAEEETEDERRAILFYDFYREGDCIYFVPCDEGADRCLCKLNLKSGQTSVDVWLPGETKSGLIERSFLSINKSGADIILTPFHADDVYVFNMEKGRARKYVLSETCEYRLFDKTIQYKNNLFLKPKCYPALVKVDLSTYTFMEYKDCMEEFLPKTPVTKEKVIWAVVVLENYLYLGAAYQSKILKIDMDSGRHEIKQIGNYDFGFQSMCYDGQYFWLSAYGKNVIVCWNEESGETCASEYPVEECEEVGILESTSLVDAGKYIYLFQVFAQPVLRMEKVTEEFEIVPIKTRKPEGFHKKLGRKGWGYSFARPFEQDRILAFNIYNYTLYILDMKENICVSYPCRLDKETIKRVEKRRIEGKYLAKATPYYIEEGTIGLSQFLDYITNIDEELGKEEQKVYQNGLKFGDGSSGEHIHQYIKECV